LPLPARMHNKRQVCSAVDKNYGHAALCPSYMVIFSIVPTLWRGNPCLSRSGGVYDTGRWSVQGLRTHAGAWVRWGNRNDTIIQGLPDFPSSKPFFIGVLSAAYSLLCRDIGSHAKWGMFLLFCLLTGLLLACTKSIIRFQVSVAGHKRELRESRRWARRCDRGRVV